MSSPLASAARECLLAAIRAVDPRELSSGALSDWSGTLAPNSVQVIAIGKAAAGMLHGASDALGAAIAGGVLVAPGLDSSLPAGVRGFSGGHPLPNESGARGATEIMRTLGRLAPDARVLVLISGGASSLTTFPADGVTLDDIIETSRTLMNAGADIRELNCVRKHLDRLKGGLMARAARGAAVRALVLSDVIGDPLDVIASGPLVADPTTYADAIDVLRRRGVWGGAPRAVRDHLAHGARGEHPETPKAGDPCFSSVRIEVVGNNALAVQGAAREARRRGMTVEVESAPIHGEARVEGAAFARRLTESGGRTSGAATRCIVGGGETTVTVAGSGLGGRNLEFAAGAALVIDGWRDIAIGSIGTDGRDGPTDAAGAVVDAGTAGRLRERHMELSAYLNRNDTLRPLEAADTVVHTGPTGTNVMDVYIGIVRDAEMSVAQ